MRTSNHRIEATLHHLARSIPMALISCLLVQSSFAQEKPVVFPGTVVKLEQLTGDLDSPRGVATRSLTGKRFGLGSTDLGSSFEHDGKLWFLFGDSSGRPGGRDAIAWTNSKSSDDLVLEFPLAKDGLWAPLTVAGIGQGVFEIPSHGISVGGKAYVVFTTDHSEAVVMGRSVLAVQREEDPAQFERLWDLSSTHFINVALAKAKRSDFPGLPEPQSVLIFGSGTYRNSSVRLACTSESRMEERAALRYFQGVDAQGEPSWSDREADAQALFDHEQVGEFSVAWIEPLQRWLMLYNASEPRGIVMRTAKEPWGPWSEGQVIFDPHEDQGYGHFLHASHLSERVDNFHDPGKANKWGGEYGPYLIPRFTSGDQDRCRVHFTMSTWNPYQVVLMQADLGYPERLGDRKQVTTSIAPTSEGWVQHGDFLRAFERGDRAHWSTHAKAGDADRGVAHYPLVGSSDAVLEFRVHGGHGEIVLVKETQEPPVDLPVTELSSFHEALKAGTYGQVVECVRGAHANESDLEVRWSLDRFDGESLRLYVIDSSIRPWGFISFSDFRLEQWRAAD